MWSFLAKGGPVMIPLGLCSLLAATITFERVLALRRSRILPREIVDITEAVEPGRDLSVAITLCGRSRGAFSAVVRAGLEHAGEPWEVMRDAVLDAGRQEIPRLERNLVFLETIAGVAPLLGLLGTVTGMMKVFRAISSGALGDPAMLSTGISEAMICTATGLAIGIPTLVAYNLIAARAETYVVEIESYASRLVSRLRQRRAEVLS
jgi:biopolymer transport protein ExbB